MILVVGGTGVLGKRVVGRLRAQGQAVRVLTRQPAGAGSLRALGAEIVQGDLIDAASLDAACRGVTQVLASAHGLLGRGRYRSEHVDDAGHRQLMAAAKQARVERFVYLSAFGAAADHPVDFWRTKHAVEQHLRASGLPHVILRPSAFMEWHAHEFIGKAIVVGGTARLIGPGTKPRNFIAADDVAELAVRALRGELPDGTVLECGGPSNHSNLEVAQKYAAACGVPLKVSHLPAGVAAFLAPLVRPLHPGIARVLEFNSLPDDAFEERFDPSGLLARWPLTLTRLDDFIAAQVQAARAAPTDR